MVGAFEDFRELQESLLDVLKSLFSFGFQTNRKLVAIKYFIGKELFSF